MCNVVCKVVSFTVYGFTRARAALPATFCHVKKDTLWFCLKSPPDRFTFTPDAFKKFLHTGAARHDAKSWHVTWARYAQLGLGKLQIFCNEQRQAKFVIRTFKESMLNSVSAASQLGEKKKPPNVDAEEEGEGGETGERSLHVPKAGARARGVKPENTAEQDLNTKYNALLKEARLLNWGESVNSLLTPKTTAKSKAKAKIPTSVPA